MAIFKWVGGSVFLDQGRYDVASDWEDLTAGTAGVASPGNADTADIAGVQNAGIYRLGALFIFPIGGGNTQVDFFAPQDPLTLQEDPNAIVGYTIQDQILNVDGTQGAVSLWLENSRLTNVALNVTGTAVISSYLDNTVTGTITVGNPTTPGFLQDELIPYDTALIGPADHYPVTTFDAAITIGAGSTLDFEAGSDDVVGVINNGAIDVSAGGTFIVDDTDNANAATYQGGVTLAGSHNVLLGNGGAITLDGAAGQTTTAILLADTQGPGTIDINGHGAARSATTLTVDGYLMDQTVTLTDGTVTVNDASDAVQQPGDAGFDVSGGSFTFADGNGELVLHQAALTTLAFNADDTGEVQTPDGRTPFTTPISGFRAGDVIALPGKYLGGFGLSTYVTSYDATTGVLQVQSPAGIVGNPPEILASLTLLGGYDHALFHLAGNSSTEELDVTYGGEPVSAQLAGASAFSRSITDNPTPALSGLAPAGSIVTLTSGTAIVGSATADAVTGVWSATITAPLGLGVQTITATSSAAGAGSSGPVSLYELPAPVAGVSTADVGSFDLASLLGKGYSLQFMSDTEAVTLVNGTLSVGPDTNEAFLQRLYKGLLDRPGDTGGLSSFDQQLNSGASQPDIAAAFLNSTENQNLYGVTSNTQFVTDLYSGFLGRAPDAAGLGGWTSALDQGVTRAQVVVGFAQSAESKTYLAADTADVWAPNPNGELITQLYKTGLDRNPDLGGLQNDVQALQNGVSAAQLAQDIAASPEFAALHAGQSNMQLVTSFYQDGLGRAPDTSGLNVWVGALQSGTSPATVLLSFASSQEAYIHLAPVI